MAKNILQKHWDGSGWVELHPVTKASNVFSGDGISVESKLENKADKTQVLTDINTHNEALDSHEDIRDIMGELASLTTEEKANLVSAINEVKAQSNDIEAQVAKVTYDNAGAHNSIFRGKYLGSSVTAEQYVNIQNGTFKDLYIGDYWTIGGINWRIAAFNYYRNTGDSLVPSNHITIVPDTQLYDYGMNPTNITTGGYANSDMVLNGLEQAKTTIRGMFGNHLIKHRQLLSNATTDGEASGWIWVDSEVDLMSEIMVYGSVVWGESTIGGSGYNIGVGKSQLPLFALNPQSINNRQSYWLRDVVSATHFARVSYDGTATYYSASLALGVRPAFSIS